jgi:acyl-CoA synthetase (AMP-forming)/AMP-acid ligase II
VVVVHRQDWAGGYIGVAQEAGMSAESMAHPRTLITSDWPPDTAPALAEETHLGAAVVGGTLRLTDDSDPDALQATVAGERSSLVISTSPTGAVLTQTTDASGASVHPMYGQPELSAVTFLDGRPLPHTGVRIVEPNTDEVQPLGVLGEICARGHSQMIGYLDDPVGTAAVVDADGWLHTGDLGAMDEHGTITLAGRRTS